ncbi:unnamed protein product [Trichobilharzia regenti]|nr:unnamed protein product [Trichobilharzia regenti]
MTEESVKVSTAVAESNKQPNQLTTEEEDRLQCEANEDSTGSEDLRLFLKELHEKVKEDQQQQQQQQQQFQQSQPYNPVIPSSGQLLPPAYPTGAGEFSIDATSASHYSSSQCNNLKEAEAGLIAYRGNHPHPQHLIQPGNHVVQYQTGPVIEQAYHTSVAGEFCFLKLRNMFVARF